MRNSIRLAAVGVLAAVSFSTAASAATSASADATAEVLSTLAVIPVQDLDFGQIAVNGDGDVVVGADGINSCGAQLVCAGIRQAATFDVLGTPGVGVTASVTDASILLTHDFDNTKTFSLDAFTVNFPGGTTLIGGLTSFNVGGTLHVTSANAMQGMYRGTFNVSVEYQ